ncbi:glycosyltransferase [Synechococcus virus S-PRM1]|jgi:G3E family GTPase|uniref:Glycosyltransferase n=1 Tax=Synechococcus virus S-PRM1 TaxID=2100130 RepID=A0A346FKG4_9CAUD|nr:glycosyltransferase [Synechococcus virus S-PRM1]AXN58469.1 glycosyltransferase [Synechococcus virus S-PRM1]
MATRKTTRKPSVSAEPAVEISDDVYMSKYDKISEEKFAELEARIAKLEAFEAQAKQIKGWFPQKWS